LATGILLLRSPSKGADAIGAQEIVHLPTAKHRHECRRGKHECSLHAIVARASGRHVGIHADVGADAIGALEFLHFSQAAAA
jgi:hypothetical protein